MCKHVLNAQVSIFSRCCRKWFDCAECHAEKESHQLMKTMEMIFACKKCKKTFRKRVEDFEEADEYCPHCDNHYVLDAVTPQAALKVESDDTRMDSRMLKDERVQKAGDGEVKNIWDVGEKVDGKLG